MNYRILFTGLIIIILGSVIVYLNPDPLIIGLGSFEVRTSTGIACVSTFGFGLLTGIIAMLTRDIPRQRKLRVLDPD